MEGVGGPGVLEVGEDQLLVLLFVMEAQQDRRRDFPQGLSTRRPEELGHVLVHVGTVAEHFHDRRAGQQPPLRPRPARPHALVVRVEKGPKLGMEGPITRQVRRQQERFKEPRRVGQMPLHRARIRHGLDDIILRRQRLAQGFRAAADGSIGILKGGAVRRG